MKTPKPEAAASDLAAELTLEAIVEAFAQRDFERADRMLDLLREQWVDDDSGGGPGRGQTL